MNISFSDLSSKFYRTIRVGIYITILGIVIFYLMLPEGVFEKSIYCHANGFARRWDGTCTGWTQNLALSSVIGDLLHWWSYTTISMMIFLYHPIIRGDFKSIMTVYLSAIFVFGCGITHLIDAYTVFNPTYFQQVIYKIANGLVSVLAMFFVVYGLLRAVIVSEIRKGQINSFKV